MGRKSINGEEGREEWRERRLRTENERKEGAREKPVSILDDMVLKVQEGGEE